MSDAEKLKAHLRGCAECSQGDYCDEGELYGGDVTHAYLTRITVSNGCTAAGAAARAAAYRASRCKTNICGDFDNGIVCDRIKGHWGDCAGSHSPSDTKLWTRP